MVVARGWEDMTSMSTSGLKGTEFQFCNMKTALEMSGADGRTTILNVLNITGLYILK